MRALLSRLTYANVVATLALFLALGGGAVWAAGQIGKNAVKSKNIARNAVKSRNIATNAVSARNLARGSVKAPELAANAVTNRNLAKGAITRSKLQQGTLAGLQVVDVQATDIPGLREESPGPQGTPIALSGSPSFTSAGGKSYLLLAELRGTPADADGTAVEECAPFVTIFVNGEPVAFVDVRANAAASTPFAVRNVGSVSTAVGLRTAGMTQTLSASTFGDPGCAATTTGNLRVTVVELG